MRNHLLTAFLLAGSMLGALPAQAQSNGGSGRAIEGRVDRLEGEMRAVQRKVFPGGSGGQYIQPDNRPADPDAILAGSPTSPVADLTARVDSLENQLRMLTAQTETNQHRLQGLDSRLKTLEANAAAAAAAAAPPAPAPTDEGGGFDRPVPTRPTADRPATPPRATPAKPSVTPPPVVSTKDPARAQQVAAVERPDSGDVAEDTYLYGYRLWAAHLYPEAEAQFTTVVAKFPTHKRASYAQNLLGRSYLEDGQPSRASLAFYDNYKKWPDGDRAPESLFFLAQALVKLDKPAAQVCKVYTELQRSYGAKVEADARMKAGVAKGRAASNCS
ncbi:tetratricopeptide repeat protein [Sphingomonas sp. UYP23]